MTELGGSAVSQPPISVIGLGKLGAPMAAVLASRGFDVTGLDVNDSFVAAINQGIAPVPEPQLQDLIDRCRQRLRATHSYDEAVAASDITFVVVPTPSGSDALFSGEFVVAAVRSLGQALRSKAGRHIVAITSTVMPGSMDGEIRREIELASGRSIGPRLGLAYNPEFIALGTVVHDLLRPDFVLIGESDPQTGDEVEAIHQRVCENNPPVRRMNFINAELAKIAVNTFVTTKISYANMLAETCDRLPGADVDIVATAIGTDSRIGPKYLKGAVGYGGPCFPRDNKAFAAFSRKLNVRCDLAEATDAINDHQLERLVAVVGAHASPGDRIGVLGLSYKPDTAVVEDSQGVALAARLSADGYVVTVFDPEAMRAAKTLLGDRVLYANDVADALAVDVAIVTTPWRQFAHRKLLDAVPAGNRLVIVDPWRILANDDVPATVSLIRMGSGA